MLHQISWFTYAVGIIALIIIYYLFIGLAFYQSEFQSLICKLTGKKPAFKVAGKSDLQIPDYDIMGKAELDDVVFVSPQELNFGPVDEPDEPITGITNSPAETNTRLIGNFSEMVSEVKTLIRVINESSESKENFEMLFRLIVQKYPAIMGTAYQQQINDFLLAEGAPEFPFSLSETDLSNYWTDEN
jgi:hypothetical protein